MSSHGFVCVVDGSDKEPHNLRYDAFVALLFKQQDGDIMKLHAAIGVCSEAGELADCIKANVIYNKPLDRENLVEELGDLRFFMQAVQNIWGVTEQEILQANANKLAKRYQSLTYSDHAAQQRADKSDSQEKKN